MINAISTTPKKLDDLLLTLNINLNKHLRVYEKSNNNNPDKFQVMILQNSRNIRIVSQLV